MAPSPEVLRVSTYPLPHLPEVPIGAQFISNLGPEWTESCHSKEGFQLSKGNRKGSKGNQQREEKSKGIAPCILLTCICVYNNALMPNVDNNLNCV